MPRLSLDEMRQLAEQRQADLPTAAHDLDAFRRLVMHRHAAAGLMRAEWAAPRRKRAAAGQDAGPHERASGESEAAAEAGAGPAGHPVGQAQGGYL